MIAAPLSDDGPSSEARANLTHPFRKAALTLVALNGVAVVQPLLGVLGDGATFFVAAGAGRAQILVFTLGLLTLVPAVLLVAVVVVHRFSPKAASIVLAAEVGALAGVALGPPIADALGLGEALAAATWIVVAASVGVAFARFEPFRMFTRVLAFAPILFVTAFLLFSPVNDLIVPTGAASPAPDLADATTNVVVLVLDETSVAPLLGTDGEIDADRYPNFARLAASSTFYRNTTTTTPWTHLSVPALLSGRTPDFDDAPIASSYPQNLFTLLAPTRDLAVSETMTSLCPSGVCTSTTGPSFSASRFAKDVGVVYLRNRLPEPTADRWLPDIDNTWAGFGDDGGGAAGASDEEIGEDEWLEAAQARREVSTDLKFSAFMDSLHRPQRPTLWFLHLLEPHLPFRHVASGQTYEARSRPLGLESGWVTWSDQGDLADQSRARYMIELQNVDRRVGELLDRLDDEEMAGNTMLVVTSDHGVSFDAGGSRRAVPPTAANVAEVVPVPLFIRYPGQTTGMTDDRPASIIDVLPTIAEQLGAVPTGDWTFDGVPLNGPERADPRRFLWGSGADESMELPTALDTAAAPAEYDGVVGSSHEAHDLYAWGPNRHLVGQTTDGLDRAGDATHRATVTVSASVGSYDPAGDLVPAVIEGKLRDPAGVTWIAVSVNGTVGGVGPVSESEPGRFSVIVDPALLRPGPNDIAVWVVTDGELVAVRTAR
jgi:hypothetical protein